MKELTCDEKITAGKLWDVGYSFSAIATIIDGKRQDMDMHYLTEQVEEELSNRVGIVVEGTEQMLSERECEWVKIARIIESMRIENIILDSDILTEVMVYLYRCFHLIEVSGHD